MPEQASSKIYSLLALITLAIILFFAFVHTSTAYYRHHDEALKSGAGEEDESGGASVATAHHHREIGVPVFLRIPTQLGPLHAQQANVVETILLAVLWNASGVILPEACLNTIDKQRQVGTARDQQRLYDPPFDMKSIQKSSASATSSFEGKNNKKNNNDLSIAAGLCLTFRWMWDTVLLEQRLKRHFGKLILRPGMLAKSDNDDAGKVRFDSTVQLDVSQLTWRDLSRRKLQLVPLVPSSSSSSSAFPIEVEIDTGGKLASDIQECATLPGCMPLLSLLRPSPIIQTQLIDVISHTLFSSSSSENGREGSEMKRILGENVVSVYVPCGADSGNGLSVDKHLKPIVAELERLFPFTEDKNTTTSSNKKLAKKLLPSFFFVFPSSVVQRGFPTSVEESPKKKGEREEDGGKSSRGIVDPSLHFWENISPVIWSLFSKKFRIQYDSPQTQQKTKGNEASEGNKTTQRTSKVDRDAMMMDLVLSNLQAAHHHYTPSHYPSEVLTQANSYFSIHSASFVSFSLQRQSDIFSGFVGLDRRQQQWGGVIFPRFLC